MEQQMQFSLDFQSVTIPSGERSAGSDAAGGARYCAEVSAPRSNVVQFRGDRTLATSHSGSTVATDSSSDLINRILSSVRFYE